MRWRLLISVHIATSLVVCPIKYLTCSRTIRYISATTAIHCFAAFRHSIRKSAHLVVANPYLCYTLHFFIFLIQARAGNAVPEEFDECVHVGMVYFIQFRRTNKCLGLVQANCDVLLQGPGKSSIITGIIIITF